MNVEIVSPNGSAAAEDLAIKVVIVYEDFASGIRAKHFAERLAESLDSHCSLTEAMWRSELLETPAFAEHAATGAADCDYLIVSLRGDRLLPLATRQWIEAQLKDAGERGVGLIILSDSYHGKWRVVEGTRHYLRTVCLANGVAFFSHAVTTPPPVEHTRLNSGRTPLDFELPGAMRLPALLDG
jgi:hypothetical protein